MENENLENIKDIGTPDIPQKSGAIHVITIVGQVEGHQVMGDDTKTTKYEHILPLLAAIEESEEIEALLVLLNTAGGDVEAGLGIAEMIAGMKKPTASLVLGGGHSIGVPMAVSTKKSFIATSAAMTLHPVRMTGVVIGAPQTYNYFSSMQDRIVNFITSHSNVSNEKILELMMRTDELANDIGSVIAGQEAVDYGIIDAVGSLGDALEYLHCEINKNRVDKNRKFPN